MKQQENQYRTNGNIPLYNSFKHLSGKVKEHALTVIMFVFEVKT